MMQKELKLCSLADPASFDPRVGGDAQSQGFQRLFFEGLMRFGPKGNVELALASSYEISEDQTTYFFYLKDAQWSNGDAITAYHFEKAWKQILSPAFPSRYGYAFYVIKNAKEAKEGNCPLEDVGIQAIDEKTLKITLNHPASYFLELTTSPVYFPAHEINEKFFNNSKKSHLVSNGPFLLHAYKPKSKVIAKKNPFYWDKDHVYIPQISISVVPEGSSCLALFEDGQLDYLGDPLSNDIPKDALPTLKEKKLLHYFPSPVISWYMFNVQQFPFHNAKLRKALSLAIDRQEIAKNVFYAGETPAMSVIPLHLKLQKTLKYPLYDPQQAKELFHEALQELNLSHKTFPKIKISGHLKNLFMAQIIQEEWKKNLDIDAEIDLCEWNVYLDKVGNRNYQVGAMGWETWLNDPIYNLEHFKYRSSRLNWTGWENPEFIELLNLSDREKDKDRRLELLRKAEDLLLEEMPVIPLFHQTRIYLISKRLKNFYFTPLGHLIFTHAYLEEQE
ncbi:MAG: oligopeptide ABC transporter substrate-binding protein OppA [Simkaniaceae bacterium]